MVAHLQAKLVVFPVWNSFLGSCLSSSSLKDFMVLFRENDVPAFVSSMSCEETLVSLGVLLYFLYKKKLTLILGFQNIYTFSILSVNHILLLFVAFNMNILVIVFHFFF